MQKKTRMYVCMYERLRVYVRVRKGIYSNKNGVKPLLVSPQASITTLFSYPENNCSDRFLKLTKFKWHALTKVPWKIRETRASHFPRNHCPSCHPFISAKTREWFVVIISPIKIAPVSFRRKTHAIGLGFFGLGICWQKAHGCVSISFITYFPILPLTNIQHT